MRNKYPHLDSLWKRTGYGRVEDRCREPRKPLGSNYVHMGDVLAVLAIVIAALVVAFGILGAGS